jgi:uncharacterized protein (DUF488 family)
MLLTCAVTTIYTIGHSTRTLDEFIALLQAHGIERLADIRSYPASRRLPWFQGPQHPPFMTDEEGDRNLALETTLPRAAIEYTWMRALGGRRKKMMDDSPNVALRAPAFRNYADYMMTTEFEHAAEELVRLADVSQVHGKRTAIMCAEAQVYWHCHRMLVSDWLAAHGHTVLHIATAAEPKQHKMTPEARMESGKLLYRGDTLF